MTNKTIFKLQMDCYLLDAKEGIDNYDEARGFLNACEGFGIINFEQNLEWRCKILEKIGDNNIVKVNAGSLIENEYREINIPIRDICAISDTCIWLTDMLLGYDGQIDKLRNELRKYVTMVKFGITLFINWERTKIIDCNEGMYNIKVGKWLFGGEIV